MSLLVSADHGKTISATSVFVASFRSFSKVLCLKIGGFERRFEVQRFLPDPRDIKRRGNMSGIWTLIQSLPVSCKMIRWLGKRIYFFHGNDRFEEENYALDLGKMSSREKKRFGVRLNRLRRQEEILLDKEILEDIRMKVFLDLTLLGGEILSSSYSVSPLEAKIDLINRLLCMYELEGKGKRAKLKKIEGVKTNFCFCLTEDYSIVRLSELDNEGNYLYLSLPDTERLMNVFKSSVGVLDRDYAIMTTDQEIAVRARDLMVTCDSILDIKRVQAQLSLTSKLVSGNDAMWLEKDRGKIVSSWDVTMGCSFNKVSILVLNEESISSFIEAYEKVFSKDYFDRKVDLRDCYVSKKLGRSYGLGKDFVSPLWVPMTRKNYSGGTVLVNGLAFGKDGSKFLGPLLFSRQRQRSVLLAVLNDGPDKPDVIWQMILGKYGGMTGGKYINVRPGVVYYKGDEDVNDIITTAVLQAFGISSPVDLLEGLPLLPECFHSEGLVSSSLEGVD